MDRFGLDYYYGRSLQKGTMVVVMLHGSEIAGVALLVVERKRIVVEMLSRNTLSGAHGVGAQMLGCIEESIAAGLGINEVYLESLDRRKLRDFYSRKGFIPYGPALYDREWGILHPMVKKIASIRGQRTSGSSMCEGQEIESLADHQVEVHKVKATTPGWEGRD